MAKDSYYFRHDYNSRNDPKLKMLKKKHKSGKGVYWDLVEMLHEQGGKLPLDYELLSVDLDEDENLIKSVVEDFKLFRKNKKFFWSDRVKRNLEQRQERSKVARTNVSKRYNGSTMVVPLNNQPSTIKGEEIKGEESKGKENKKTRPVFIPPSLEEFKAYFLSNGYREDRAIRAWEGYETAKWHDSKGNKIINWKQKCQHVWFRPENEYKPITDGKTEMVF